MLLRGVRHATGARPRRNGQSRPYQRADHTARLTRPAHDPQTRLLAVAIHDFGPARKPKMGARQLDADGLADLKPAAGDQHPPFG